MKPPVSPPVSVMLTGLLTAFIISVWSMSACGRTLTKRLYMPMPVELRDSFLTLSLGSDPSVGTQLVDVRGAMAGIGERPGLATAYWGIDLIGGGDTLRLTLRHGNSAFGDLLDKRVNMLTASIGGRVVEEKDVAQFESSSGVYNTIRLTIDRESEELTVSGGGKSVADIFTIPLRPMEVPEELRVWSRGRLTLSSVSMESAFSPQKTLATAWTQDSLTAYLKNSDDPLEGYWQYLDRENDPQYARPGGRYLLAVVRSAAGNELEEDTGYDIIYVSGAETYRDRWSPMMLKGRLRPTIFQDHYDLHWIDSSFEPIERDIHANVTDGSILSLSFPLLKTTLRFSKMPLK